MKVQLLQGTPKPPENSLIVCAGTVTQHTADRMGAGFNLFHQYFPDDVSSDPNNHHGWKGELNQILTNYHQQKKNMPVYLRIAQHGAYVGGVATVACLRRDDQVNPCHTQMSLADLEEQYKEAVRQAIQDAIQMKRPLYIQPLGIGVYGWDPKLAADLFGDVLTDFQNNDLEIYIPLYNQTPNSADQTFATQLQAGLDRGLQARVRNADRRHDEMISRPNPNSASNTNTPVRFSFILKCAIFGCAALSATLLVISLLAVLSILSIAAKTTAILGAVGAVSGGAAFCLFRHATKQAQEVSEGSRYLLQAR